MNYKITKIKNTSSKQGVLLESATHPAGHSFYRISLMMFWNVSS